MQGLSHRGGRGTPRRSALLRAALAAALLVGAGATACSSDSTAGGTVTVLASWQGQEQSDFQQVLDAFQQRTGYHVRYVGRADAASLLQEDVAAGQPPDVAVIPSVGALNDYITQHRLLPLDGVLDERSLTAAYGAPWVDVMKAGQPHLYVAVVKAGLKSLIWYDPQHLDRFTSTPPTTITDLEALTQKISASGATPWCLGMNDTPANGWPGTDWLEDIVLKTYGPDVYAQWAAGKLSWTGPEITGAFDTLNNLLMPGGHSAVYGGNDSALMTNYGEAGRTMITGNPPGCYLDHEASFIINNYTAYGTPSATPPVPAPVPGTDFAAMDFPAVASAPQYARAEEVTADLVGMFRDTPAARALIRFLAGDDAQRIWPAIPNSGAFTVDRDITPDSLYPADSVPGKIATSLDQATSINLDASDQMPAALQNAFTRGMLEYLDNPDQLPIILQTIEHVRTTLQTTSPSP